MVVKSKLKKKPVKTIRQKQNQKQIQNVNQIVRIYLDERKKARRKKTAPQKNLKGVGSSNIIMPSYFPSQNPLSNMYPLQQPYNPYFYPRPPPPPPQAPAVVREPAVVRDNVIPNTAPLSSQSLTPTPPSSPTNSTISSLTDPTYDTLIPPSINVPTNPLVAPSPPVNNFPNLQPINAVIPSPDVVPTNVGNAERNRPVQVSLPLYTQDPVEDELAMDFNMGLVHSTEEGPPAELPLLPPEEIPPDIIARYENLRGNRQGRRPTNIDGYNRAIARFVAENIREANTRGTQTDYGQAEEREGY